MLPGIDLNLLSTTPIFSIIQQVHIEHICSKVRRVGVHAFIMFSLKHGANAADHACTTLGACQDIIKVSVLVFQ